MDWFLYDNGLRHERVNFLISFTLLQMELVTLIWLSLLATLFLW